jgi:hypothetical protein
MNAKLFVSIAFAALSLSANAAVILEDNFNDGTVDSSKFVTWGNTVSEHDGVLDVRTDVTDAGGAASTINFAPQNYIQVTATHYIHAANDFTFSGIGLGNLQHGEDANIVYLSWQRSGWSPDNCNDPNNYDKILVRDGSCQYFTNITSSNYFDKWITTTITFDAITGNFTADLNSDGIIDISTTVPVDRRTPVTNVELASSGWFTGHYHQFDSIVIESTNSSIPEPTTFSIFSLGLIALGSASRRRLHNP